MKKVSAKWLDKAITKYSMVDSKSEDVNVYLALCELRERRIEDTQDKQDKHSKVIRCTDVDDITILV